MKRLIILLVSVILLAGFHSYAHASDWDVAGKILTGIEGMRILTGGKVDIIGSMTGVGRDRSREVIIREYRHYDGPDYHNYSGRIWVPHYVWRKKWVPEHTEYDQKLGKVIVEGHYVEYKAQTGGHWEYRTRNKRHSYR